MSAAPMEVLDARNTDIRDVSSLEPMAVVSAEIDKQIATARKYPRSIQRFRQSLQGQVTITEDIARQCNYALPRGGKKIEGPSIRFAEMVVANWGNCRVAQRIVGEEEQFIVAQGLYMDLESNMAITIEARRRIVDSKGNRFDVDMRGVTGNAAGSIALRNAILRGIPKALWWDAYQASRLTIVGDLRTMSDKRNIAIEYFRGLGVVEAQVFEALGIAGIADIGADQLITLAGFRTAIEDEGRDPEELFPRAETKASRSTKAADKDKKPPKPPADPNKTSDGAGGSAPKPQAQAPEGAAPSGTRTSDGAADAQQGAAGSSSGTAAESGPRAPSEVPPVANAASAKVYGDALKHAVANARTSEAIDDLHAESMKSGQWRALQKYDARLHADVSSLMASRQADLDSDDGQRPPD